MLRERERKLRESFNLAPDAALIARDVAEGCDVPAQVAAHLARVQSEWQIIAAQRAAEVDPDEYRARLYSMIKQKLKPSEYRKPSHYRALMHVYHKQ